MKPVFHIRDAVQIFAMVVLIKTRSQIRNRFAQPGRVRRIIGTFFVFFFNF